MKKFLFLLTALLCLVLCSAVSADNYCQIDDNGCYVIDEEGVSSYIMFWSEAARQSIMGDLSAPNELVVPRPAGGSDRLPLLVPADAVSASASVSNVVDASNCFEVMIYGFLAQEKCSDRAGCITKLNNMGMTDNTSCMEIYDSSFTGTDRCTFTCMLGKMNNGVVASRTEYLDCRQEVCHAGV